MKIQNEALRDELAARYVLGTMQGSARLRFEHYLRDDSALRQHVDTWQERLQPLLDGLSPVAPSPQVWPRIAKRLGIDDSAAKTAARSWFWRPAFGAFAVVLLISGVMLREPVRQNLLFLPDVQVAFADENQQPLWKVEVDSSNNRLRVTALRELAVADDKSMQLWLLRDGDQAPLSLGLLPIHAGEEIRAQARDAIISGTGLAVSLEPAGGSPTGLPTGPVLYVQSLPS